MQTTIRKIMPYLVFIISFQSFKCQNTINKGVDQSGIKVETQPSDFNYYVKPKQFLPVQNVANSKYHQQSSWGAFECRIDSRSWKSCRFCRFNKCIASGMRPGTQSIKKEYTCWYLLLITFIIRCILVFIYIFKQLELISPLIAFQACFSC